MTGLLLWLQRRSLRSPTQWFLTCNFALILYYIITIITDYQHFSKYYSVLRKPSSRELLLSGTDLQFVFGFYKTLTSFFADSVWNWYPIRQMLHTIYKYTWMRVSILKIFLLPIVLLLLYSELVSSMGLVDLFIML